jgi:membrane protein DedA with SNARE-associated domain
VTADPRHYAIEEVLRDGGSIHVRAICPDDRERLLAHFHRLSARSVYFRFFGAKRRLTDAELDRFTRLDFVHDVGLVATLLAAALCGDNCNYWIGRWIGPKVFHFERSRWFNPAHLARAHAFYERHGGKTIILARFVPIVRTYVPFVAGVGAMPYVRYLAFCILGAAIWVVSLCLAGYWFGNQPIVRNNLTAVILLIVAVSVSPGVLAWLRSRRQARAG